MSEETRTNTADLKDGEERTQADPDRLEARVAPSTPRGEGGAVSEDPSETASSERVVADGKDGDSSSPAPQNRRRGKAVVAGVVACAVALCAVVAGVGYATGWLGSAPSSTEDRATVQSSDSVDQTASGESQKKDQASGKAASSASEPSSAPAADSADAAAGGASEPAASADASASESASAPEASPAPAPAPAPQPEPEPAPPAPSTVTVSVYIDSSRAASSGYPASLGGGTVTLNQGSSVYDALVATGVGVGGSSSYVSSIGGLAEFACGPGSGWLYFVNGSSPGYGSGSYILNGGESITWIYTCDMGNDL